ncbi:energy transducer TonB [Alteromonas sp. 5E99-2]|uniref:energy transducer TonB n=1 Tax=Alteromonas sp. 5E99-2 TaxID=2817683 RepID=UPI001A98DF9E|nr:energy transducer TonB [Alteromonas sp. 5E99-2]MBO1255390.1 energy transducer TonB [Alteromonas sp. 5E99-2]
MLYENSLNFFFSILILGCTSTQKIVLNQNPIEVSKDTIDEYWVLKNDKFSFPLSSKQISKNLEDGYVTLQYVIDSNGNTFNPEIIKSVPEAAWGLASVKAVSKQKFIPAKSNIQKVPENYTQTIFFK